MEKPARPPALRAASPRSYSLLDPADLGALVAALQRAGAAPENPAPAEVARLALGGGLALLYSSGAVVVAGQHPTTLLRLLDRWAGQTAPAALLVKRSASSWHTERPGDLLAALSKRPGLELWRPRASDDRCRNELGRLYHRHGTAWEPNPAAIVVAMDGWVRVTGADRQRAAEILDAIAAEAAPVEAAPNKGAAPVEQLALFAEVQR